MADKVKPLKKQVAVTTGYDAMLSGVIDLLEQARRTSVRAVNAIMTATYWEVGRRIVEFEQGGEVRAEYGSVLLKRLSNDLLPVFGRGFGWRNIYQMRLFYQAYPEILQTASAKFGGGSVSFSAPLVMLCPTDVGG